MNTTFSKVLVACVLGGVISLTPCNSPSLPDHVSAQEGPRSTDADDSRRNTAVSALEKLFGEEAYVGKRDDGGVKIQFFTNNDRVIGNVERVSAGVRDEVTMVVLDQSPISPSAVKALSSFRNLRSLHVDFLGTWPKGMSDVVVNAPALESLWCHDLNIGKDEVEELAKARGLKVLMMGGNPLKSGQFAPLGKLTRLRQLSLARMPLEDADLTILAGMSDLELLWLSETNVTDAGMKELRHLKKLLTVALVGSRVTKDGARELKKALPHAIISWGKSGESGIVGGQSED